MPRPKRYKKKFRGKMDMEHRPYINIGNAKMVAPFEIEGFINLKDIPPEDIKRVSPEQHYVHVFVKRFPSMDYKKYFIGIYSQRASVPQELTRDEKATNLF